jgi:hypothetical protein
MPSFKEARTAILELVDSYTGLTMEQISLLLPREMIIFDIKKLVLEMVEAGSIKECNLFPESENGLVVYATPPRHFR